MESTPPNPLVRMVCAVWFREFSIRTFTSVLLSFLAAMLSPSGPPTAKRVATVSAFLAVGFSHARYPTRYETQSI